MLFLFFSDNKRRIRKYPAVRSCVTGWWRAGDMVTHGTKCFWRDKMHPAPITAPELKLHQLNFGWSRNKTIRSNNTRVQLQRASASCCSVTSHQGTALCKVTVPVPTVQVPQVPSPSRSLGGLAGFGGTQLSSGNSSSLSTLGKSWEGFQIPLLGSQSPPFCTRSQSGESSRLVSL